MNDINRDIGRRVREIRETARLTQAQLGKILGVEKATVSKYESGDTKISPESLIELAKLGGKSIDWICSGVTDSHITTTASSDDSEQPVTVAINGGTAHVDVHHGQVNEAAGSYGQNPIEMAFLNDWRSLSDVVKMRIWTMVKEEMEKNKPEA